LWLKTYRDETPLAYAKRHHIFYDAKVIYKEFAWARRKYAVAKYFEYN